MHIHNHNLEAIHIHGNLINKLSKHCFAIKIIKSFANKNIVKPLYFANLHSFQNILFWGKSTNLKKILNYKKEQ